MRTVSVRERRNALVRRHCLGGDADGPVSVVQALLALHATDPASVYLSVLARSRSTSLADVSTALYERRSLVRWMAMRRTLFVFARADVPTVQAAVGVPLAATLRRSLLSRIERNGTDPRIDGDLGAWLSGVEDQVEQALSRRGTATGTGLAADVPGLTVRLLPGAASDRPQRLTTSLLTIMGTDGRLVRGAAIGSWTNRQHRWEPASAWWPDGLPMLDEASAQCDLARRWLERFGPATADDLQWWTGWTKTTTRRALAALPIEDVDLHGGPGIALAGSDDADPIAPTAALLPALDPTPMGWKHREWFLSIDASSVFDRAGNIGPTLWWDGEIIGSWAVAPDGEVRTAVVLDRGRDAVVAIEQAAGQLQDRLDGTVVTPAVRTALEQSLVAGMHS